MIAKSDINKFLTAVFLGGILYCLSQPVNSQGKDFFFAGVGTEKCGEILNALALDKSKPNELFKLMIISWMQGYISGRNHGIGAENYIELGSVSNDAQFEILVAKCRQSADKPLYIAVEELIEFLGRGKSKAH